VEIAMTVLRLHPSKPEAWALWPVFEARAKDFLVRVAGEEPNEQMVVWLRDTFVNRAELLGAWMSFEGDRVTGHLLAWADAQFGEPFVFVHQVETEPGATDGGGREQMIGELRHWVDEMNWAYERAESPLRIRRLRFSTQRSSTAWARYLQPLGMIEKERVVVTVRVDVPAPRVVVTPELVPPPVSLSMNGEGSH
jgi:hypothetical protein